MKKVLLVTGSVLAGIVALLLIIAAFRPASYKVTRSTSIAATPEQVMQLVSDFKNWDAWSPWKKMDPEAQYSYSTTTYGAGAYMEWNGKQVGKGKLTFTQITPGKSVHYDLSMLEPFASHSKGSFEMAANDDQILTLTWSDVGDLPYPVGRLWSLFFDFDQLIGTDFENGLADIKKIAESLPKTPEVSIAPVVIDYPGSAIITIRKKVPNAQIGEAMGEIYQTIQQFLASKNEAPANLPPFAIWHLYGVSESDFEAGFFMDKYVPGKGEIVSSSLKAGKVVKVDYYGAYENTESTYQAVYQWISQQNYKPNGAPWEVYVTDPEIEKDTTQWLTELYFPIQ